MHSPNQSIEFLHPHKFRPTEDLKDKCREFALCQDLTSRDLYSQMSKTKQDMSNRTYDIYLGKLAEFAVFDLLTTRCINKFLGVSSPDLKIYRTPEDKKKSASVPDLNCIKRQPIELLDDQGNWIGTHFKRQNFHVKVCSWKSLQFSQSYHKCGSFWSIKPREQGVSRTAIDSEDVYVLCQEQPNGDINVVAMCGSQFVKNNIKASRGPVYTDYCKFLYQEDL